MISRNANIKGYWNRIKLTPQEIDEVMEQLIHKNKIELVRAEIESQKFMKKYNTKIPYEKIVQMLYEKQAVASYTVLSNALDEKIFNMKNSLTKSKKEEKIEPKKDVKPSEIDKAFKDIEPM